MTAPSVFLSAGEPSGDLHGAEVARELALRWPGVRLRGLGGPRMEREGVELLAGLDRLAVMGFAEVVRDLPFFYRLERQVRRELRETPPDLVIPIDYPGFNLRLARRAHEAGIPVLYYIAPQVWAWKQERAARLARHADRLAVILPFEEPLFRKHGAKVSFVGHPLAEAMDGLPPRESFCRGLGLDPERPILALFPGSRRQELHRHLLLFAEAAEEVRRTRQEVQPVVAASGDLPAEAYSEVPYARSDDPEALLHHARAALVKSGTSTLQAALTGTPMVIAYRTHPLTFRLARRLVRVPHIGLANLVAGERVAPELLQDAATPGALARALAPLLVDGLEREKALRGLSRVRRSLMPAGPERPVARRVVELAAELLPPERTGGRQGRRMPS